MTIIPIRRAFIDTDIVGSVTDPMGLGLEAMLFGDVRTQGVAMLMADAPAEHRDPVIEFTNSRGVTTHHGHVAAHVGAVVLGV